MNSLQQSFTDFVAYRRRHRTGPDGSNPLGQLRVPVPIARAYGFSRGKPVDRFYIERYLDAQAALVRGRVLEIGDNEYTLTYGGDRVSRSDILHFDASNPKATFVGDLSRCEHIPDALFDCIILTQTLHLIYDIRHALRHVHRLLKPGGALIATFPGLSQISDETWGPTWCWGWSPRQAESLLRDAFPDGQVVSEGLGNRLAAVAFLQGMVIEEINTQLLTGADGTCAFVVGAVAVRAGEGSAAPR